MVVGGALTLMRKVYPPGGIPQAVAVHKTPLPAEDAGATCLSLEEAQARLASPGRPDGLLARLSLLAEAIPQGELESLPQDLAANLEHYPYGGPKREA